MGDQIKMKEMHQRETNNLGWVPHDNTESIDTAVSKLTNRKTLLQVCTNTLYSKTTLL